MEEKRVVWVGTADDDLRAFPEKARRRAGYELHQVQIGLSPSDWKPVRTVGPGVREIRVHVGGAWPGSRLATVFAHRGGTDG